MGKLGALYTPFWLWLSLKSKISLDLAASACCRQAEDQVNDISTPSLERESQVNMTRMWCHLLLFNSSCILLVLSTKQLEI